MVYDVLIVGGGPAGMTAALYALRSGKTVLILEKENFGGQIANSPRVENYPTVKEISGLELSDKLFTQITDLGAEFELDEVTKVEKEDKLFRVSTKYGAYASKSVIIATGVSHRKMNLPNEEQLIGKGISFCAVCDGSFYKGQEVYLIGDGNTALQYALLLVNYCPKVHMFTLTNKFFGDQVLQERVINNDRIILYRNKSLVEYKGDKELTGLVFEDMEDHTKTEFFTNNVFVAIGQVPHNEVFKNLVELDNRGFILTDENMMTKTQGLFAVGDCRQKGVRQFITACNDGAIAALNAVKNL